ncbi:hypothetical protein MM26B8_00250 [Mycoplasmopsis meleagridis]|uniref:S1 motif domain-containing protein n=1 Tax=Mycoplasmopsis meleagridis ATCC 25294 TaxID=1264554 RepID=A0A0F5H1Y3_9BACT|nr:hypothetical protein [Mycoplasmopsis meleagridis]KKB26847.1 hypothetical protein MMELEA_05300 [Mycoplasmopsis meleagridis ATCC 25294]KUH47393.1 hypothetical protein ASB56_01650 [Mycoplasmopsis meleagridis]OAD18583.1 hypothetical protein MM26B8_00250 [Mycoplasmopsis meleagridis]VEU77414.1 Uncharacterised protein [Mycoplasmopsis meleagridis]
MQKKGDICYGKIVSISKKNLVVKSTRGRLFSIPFSKVTDWKKKDLTKEFIVGEKINFVIEEFNKENAIGNFKLLHPLFSRSPFTAKIIETKHGFETLKNSIEIDNQND